MEGTKLDSISDQGVYKCGHLPTLKKVGAIFVWKNVSKISMLDDKNYLKRGGILKRAKVFPALNVELDC